MRIDKVFRRGMPSYVLQRMTTYWPARKYCALLSATMKPRFKGSVPESAQIAVADLEREGVHFKLGYLSQDQVSAILDHVKGHKVNERFTPFRRDIDVDNVPEGVHVGEYPSSLITSSKELMSIANDPEVVGTAAKYLGCKPTISNLGLWWSFPGDGSAQEAENFHRDVDEWKFVKFFVYLTNVDEGSGPHTFVRKSHRSTKFLKIRRLDEEEVHANFPAGDILTITGKAGDAFFEDTFGLHRGTPPLTSRRLVFQVEYSINPIAVYNYAPNAVNANGLDPYLNRLYVKQ